MSARFKCRMVVRMAICLALATGLIPGMRAASFLPNSLPRKDFWDTDGTINAILASNGVVYVGGSFSYIAPKGSKLVSLDSATGAMQTDFPAFYGAGIYAILDDGAGGWFVGGDFSSIGGANRTNLVHILSDNSVDSDFQPNPNGAVRCLALDGSRLYVGGEFTMLGGQARSQIGAWDAASQTVLSWAPQANGTVSCILATGPTVYAGGYFTQIGGQTRRNIAALDRATAAALPWSPQGDGAVLAIGLQGQKLYVGGFFNRIGGQLRAGLGALDVDSNNALAWDPNPIGGKVTSLRVVCNTVYVGGYFTNLAGAPRVRVGAVDSETGQATPWNAHLDLYYAAGLPSKVLNLEVSGDRLYVAGQYSVNGQHDLNAFDTATGNLLPWDGNVNGGVTIAAVSGPRLLAGMLSSMGGLARQNLAALDEVSGVPLPFAPRLDGDVYALALSGTNLFVGGSFTYVDGFARGHLAAIDTVTGTLRTNWDASANNTVYALAAGTNAIFAGGSFSTVGGFTRQRLCSLSMLNGSVNPIWAPQADGTVYALEFAGTNLFAAGSFISISGFTRHRLAALNSTTGNVQPWNPDANQTVRALRAGNGKMYAGGSFTSMGGLARNFVAAMDLSLGFTDAWNPGADDEVRAIAISGANIFLGGIFLHVLGEERFGSAGVASDGSLLAWNPAASDQNRVYAMAASEKLVYAGGELPLAFAGVNDRFALGAFPPLGAPVILQAPSDIETTRGQTVTFQAVVTGDGPLSYTWFFNGLNLSTNTAGSPGPSIVLQNVQPNQSGTYEIVVSNALGIARAQATLTVLQPVLINTQPTSQLVATGSSVTLNVSASGNPAPLFQWRLNGVNIPGAVAPTLTISNVTPASGGAYYAVVGNKLGAINSQVAQLSIITPSLPFADNLGSRGTISGLSGTGSGNNISMTSEANEPLHAGKAGGRSVWLSWVAPSNGVATFSTRGSVFDTLLGIYTGTSISTLVPVASDEDRGGFLTSEATFNAVKDVEYLIAVDGLAGASGRIVLHWQLDTSASEFPTINTQPIGQSVVLGGNALFEVAASSPTPLSYQWFFGCQSIRGATNASLLISNVQARNVGAYRVFVMNASSHIAESAPAALEIGQFPGVLSFDKLEDALAVDAASTNHLAAVKTAGASPNILVSMGSIISQTIDTSTGTGFIKETNHCGVIGGASAWLRFQPTQDGTLMVDTIGSRFDTILAIYRDTNLIVLSSNPGAALVACDNNSAPDGVRSRLQYNTKAGIVYLAVVDGVQSAKGLATINWQLASAPTIVGGMSNVVGTFRGNVTLSSGTSSTALNTTYQWLFNGVEIAGATNSTLTLRRLQPAEAGYYSVIASNYAGYVYNTPAVLSVNVPLQLDSTLQFSGGDVHGAIWGNLNASCVLEASTDLRAWTPINVIYIQSQPQPFSDLDAPWHDKLFYRVRPYSENP